MVFVFPRLAQLRELLIELLILLAELIAKAALILIG